MLDAMVPALARASETAAMSPARLGYFYVPNGMHMPLWKPQVAGTGAGWQLSQTLEYSSPLMSVKQITLDHTHYETIPGCAAATELYGRVFKPTIHSEIYPFEELPRCMHEMHLNTQTGIPIVRVADALPESVKKIA
jgi:hypothetical protein